MVLEVAGSTPVAHPIRPRLVSAESETTHLVEAMARADRRTSTV